MASLRSILQGVLDSTDLDEKFSQNKYGNVAINFGKGLASAPKRIISGVGGGVVNVGTRVIPSLLANRQANINLSRAKQGLPQQNPTAVTRISRKLDPIGVSQGFKASQAQDRRTALKSAGAGAESILYGLGLGAAPRVLAGTAAISGGLSGGLTYAGNKLFNTNNSVSEAVGRGVSNAPIYAGINPITQKAGRFVQTALTPSFGKLVNNPIANRAIGGIAEVGEDQLLTRASELRAPTPTENLVSFVVGSVFGGVEPTKAEGRVETKNQIRDQKGRYARAIQNTTTKLKNQLKGKYLSEIDLGTPGKWVKAGERKFRIEAPQEAAGLIAGFEIETDENGRIINITYNPTKGAIGFMATAGINSKQGRKLLSNIKIKPDGSIDRTQLRGSQLDTPNSKLQNILGNEATDIGVGAVKNTNTPQQFTKQQVDETLTGAVLQEESIPRVKEMFNRVFNPLKNAPQEIQDSTQKWRSTLLKNRQKANQMAAQFSNISSDDGWKMVRYMENPTPQKAAELGFNPQQYGKEMAALRKIYNNMRDKGIKEGLEVGYLENYLNHVWNESFDDVVKARGLGKNPSFTKQRVIPNYEEGLGLGLTPAFTHPGQLAAHYRYQLNKALANKELADSLVGSGYLLPASKAPIDWRPIEAPLFPKSVHDIGGKTLVEPYAAPPNVSEAMKGIFGQDRPGFASLAAGISKTMQDITLSGGIPKTPVNAFTLANAVKEVTAGRIASPVKAFFRSFSDDASRSYFKKNSKYLKMMGEEGIPTYSNFDYQNAYQNMAENKTLKQVLGDKWDNLFSKPTFERFLPQLQTQTFKDVYEAGVRSGKSRQEARQIAGEVTKNFYGIADNFSRPRFTDDALSAVFFAPKFRESMVNFWVNNLKALNPKASGYNLNRKFLVGTAITYAMYDLLNRQLNEGRSMSENKPGKELFLEIPRENGRSWFIPMLPSIGTVPRRVAEAGSLYASGNIREGSQKAASLLSQPVSLAGQLATNRTFYGGPIAGKEDNPVTKYAGYTFEQTAHPFLGEPVAALQGRKTSSEAAMSMMELPVYPSKSSSETKNTGRGGSLFGFKLTGNANKVEAADILPKSQEATAELYKDAQRTLNKYPANKTKVEAGLTSKDLEEYQQEFDEAKQTIRLIEQQKPEEVKTIRIKVFEDSDEVEARVDQAIDMLRRSASEEELNATYQQLLDTGKMTKTVVEKINEELGTNLTKYTYGGEIRNLSGGGGGSRGRSISISPPKINPVRVSTAQRKPFKTTPLKIQPFKPTGIKLSKATYKPIDISQIIRDPLPIQKNFGNIKVIS